ncbi:zinc finger CCCH domain-containing protein 30-like protein [Tanacetum coccineum]
MEGLWKWCSMDRWPFWTFEKSALKTLGPWKIGWCCSDLISMLLGLLECLDLIDCSPGFLSSGILKLQDMRCSSGMESLVLKSFLISFMGLLVAWVIIYLVFILFMDRTRSNDADWHVHWYTCSSLRYLAYGDVLNCADWSQYGLVIQSMLGIFAFMNILGAFVNFTCGPDKCTAFHCDVSGGSVDAVEVVKVLLFVGADPNIADVNGHRPVDVIIVPPKLSGVRALLEELLMSNVSEGSLGDCKLTVSVATSSSWSPTLSSSPENGSPCSPSELVSSPTLSKFNDTPVNYTLEKKEYPIGPSLPDINNIIYSTDEFRMFSFKVRPCSRAYSHDWTECPFVQPGENARRKERSLCARRVCFFAHLPEELRPLYVSTGSAVPSPRLSAAGASVMDMAAALNLLPGSPSSVSTMSPGFNQQMSPSGNGGPHSPVSINRCPHRGTVVHPLHCTALPGSNQMMIRYSLKTKIVCGFRENAVERDQAAFTAAGTLRRRVFAPAVRFASQAVIEFIGGVIDGIGEGVGEALVQDMTRSGGRHSRTSTKM